MLRGTAAAAALAALGRFSLARGATTSSPVLAPSVPRTRRPNVLMLVADDYRHDAIRTMGDTVVQTPVLDRLAAGGMAFSQAHHMGGNFSAVCVPTRAALMTGCGVYRALADQGGGVIAPDRVTLGQHFRSAGYRTHLVGKWHNDRPSLNRTFAGGDAIFLRGITTDQNALRVHHYDPKGEYGNSSVYHPRGFSTDLFADRTIDFIRQQQARPDEPFFLYTGFTAPHDPRTPPKEFAKLYPAEQMPLPPNYAALHPFDNGELHVRDENTAPHPRTPKSVQREIAAYYGMITSLDAGIGRILAALKAAGLAENTLVVFTADHGLAVGQHGLMGKQNLYDHSTRVPLLLRGPGVPTGERSAALAYSWDLFPTLCDLTGLATPGDLDARSLSPILRRETTTHRTELHALHRDWQRMAKNDRWKLIEYAVGPERHTQLFDLRNDPWEQHNLATDPAAATPLADLRASLANWQTAIGDPGLRGLPAAKAEA